MVLDVSQLIQNDGAVKKLDFNLSLEDMSFNGQNISFTSPFSQMGEIKNVSGVLYLDLDVDVNFTTQCARCLEDVDVHHSFKISEAFSKTEQADSEEEITVLASGNIDLAEVTEMAFVGSLPINYLCDEDCKGLCKMCGVNLNRESCSCADDNIDPRLAVLKQFIKD